MRLLRNVLLLAAVPAFLFWVGVMLLASVVYGLALVVGWYLACCVFLRSARNAALLGLSIAACVAAAEGLLRAGIVRPPLAEYFDGIATTQDRPHAEQDAQLAFRLVPDNRVHYVRTRFGKVVYDVVYTTDANGFRQDGLPPVDGPRVMILGDSFAFGEGLNDDQTLGYFFKKRGFAAVNLGVPGMGPHQVLRQLQLGVPNESPGPSAHAFLDVIDEHIDRVNGRRPWLHDSPRFDVGADGRPVLNGTFLPDSAFVERLLVGSRLAALIEGRLMRDLSGEERRFVAILREIDRLAREEYRAPLLVAYHSGTAINRDLTGNRARMLELLRQSGVAFFDVYAEIPGIARDIDRYFIPLDGHPTALLNETIVDLAIPRFRNQRAGAR